VPWAAGSGALGTATSAVTGMVLVAFCMTSTASGASKIVLVWCSLAWAALSSAALGVCWWEVDAISRSSCPSMEPIVALPCTPLCKAASKNKELKPSRATGQLFPKREGSESAEKASHPAKPAVDFKTGGDLRRRGEGLQGKMWT